MQRIARHRTLTAVALLVGAFASALPAQPSRTPQLSGGAAPSGNAPAILQQIGIDQKLGAQVPLDLPFRDEEGRAVKLGDYFGKKPVVLCLVYYECPMLCTMVLNGLMRSMKQVQFNLGEEYDVVTVSFDPKETPDLARMKKNSYLSQYGRKGSEKGWHFLTGDLESIQKLTAAVGFRYKYDATSQQYAHASGIIVATPTGTLARYLLGVEYTQRDLQLAIMEASTEKVGSTTDQILLYCYHYDPVTGKYGVAVMRLVRIASVLTVLGIGSFVTLMIRRERRQRLVTESSAASGSGSTPAPPAGA